MPVSVRHEGRSAVPVHSAVVQVQGFGNQALMACHDVDQVSEGLRGVALGTNVDMHSASPCGIASSSGLAKDLDKLLQGFHVLVGEDGGDHLAFLGIRSGNAYVPLELPLSAVRHPGAPGVVAVAAGGVCVSAGSKELCGKLRRLLAGDVVHLYFYPKGLLLGFYHVHHFAYLLRFCVLCFPFRCVYIRSFEEI